VQAGFRYDWRPEPERAHLALGIHGLMPYLFEVDAAVFLSEDGDLSARVEAEYDLLVTQRLVLQPRAEVEAAFTDVPEVQVGSGVSHLELGARLRYQVTPEVAPYAGIHWTRRFGQTADFARLAGEDTNEFFVVAGASFRF
jgi:copper resistance protein B